MKGKRVVVTGGAGFIGSNLVEAFSDDNDVVVVDNLSTGRLDNIAPLIKARKIEFVRGSACDYRLMRKACRDADYLFHYAAVPSVPLSVKDPVLVNKSGIEATLSSLLAARDAGVRKFIYASSSAVYGDTRMLPTTEDAIIKPLSPYAVTKIAGEHYCRVFNGLYGLEAISLRYFNVFGPRQNPGGEYAAVIPKFITNALAGKKLKVYGDGKQTRDFLYVGDSVLANQLAAKPGLTGVYNISSGKRVTINNLAKMISGMIRPNIAIVHAPPREGEILRSEADVSRAQRDIGFQPQYSLKDGLTETIAAFRHERR